MEAKLVRLSESDEGTMGILLLEDFPEMVCLELPWRGNAKNYSSIPYGTYDCRAVKSPKFGPTYEICCVPGRDHILFHSGNFGGDIRKGKRTDIRGCVLLGSRFGKLESQTAILNSRKAFERFKNLLSGVERFGLRIVQAY